MKKFNAPTILSIILGLSVFIVCQSAMADLTYIYRGVDANASNKATLSPSQFNFTGEPATLSTFSIPNGAPVQKPCNYRFEVTGPNIQDPTAQGDSGAVTGLDGYTATFDNDPIGHWGITRPDGVTVAEAKIAVSDYAKATRGNVVYGNAATPPNCN